MTLAPALRILLTGVRGQVGFELARALSTIGEVIATDRSTLDLSNPDAIRQCVRHTRPGLIVNAAAYTAVDRAEDEFELAHAVNAMAPRILAEEAATLGAALVHYSTDYVFDGRKTSDYVEDDVTGPLNVYGRTKLEGEQALLDSDCAVLILRTGWVYGLRGSNFLLTMRRLARERSNLRVVDDQLGSPTWSRTIAQVTAQILAGQADVVQHIRRTRGIYHLTSTGQASWCDFARRIFSLDGSDTVTVEAIQTRDYPTAAARPARSVLDCARLQRTFGLRLPNWDEALAMAVEAR